LNCFGKNVRKPQGVTHTVQLNNTEMKISIRQMVNTQQLMTSRICSLIRKQLGKTSTQCTMYYRRAMVPSTLIQ